MTNRLFVHNNGSDLTFYDFYSNARACVVEAGYDPKNDPKIMNRVIVFLALASSLVGGRPIPEHSMYVQMIKFVSEYFLDAKGLEKLRMILDGSYVSSGILNLEGECMTPNEFLIYDKTVQFFHFRETEFMPKGIRRVINTELIAAKEKVTGFYDGNKKKKKVSPCKRDEGDILASPYAISSYLKHYIIGQDEVVDSFSNIAFQYYRYVKKGSLPVGKHYNVLLMGNSGCGKTSLMRAFGTIKNTKVRMVDCTGTTESGYIGKNPKDLVAESKFGTTVFYDEIDKILIPSIDGSGRDFHREIQGCFLKPIEEEGGFNIFGGSFEGISDIVSSRVSARHKHVGFSVEHTSVDSKERDNNITEEDLIKFGASREFTGRIDYVLVMRDLDEADYYKILRESEYSPVKAKIRTAKDCYNIDLKFSDKSYKELAALAVTHEVGARALGQYINRVVDPMLAKAFEKGRDHISIRGFNSCLQDGSYILA